jgi:nucleoside-diphosphate-sugar epimerase
MNPGEQRRVAITGANGMVGQILCAGLPPAFEVRPVTRSNALPDGVLADLGDIDSLVAAFTGCDAVIHLAAASGVDIPWDLILSANIVGAYNVFEAASRAGVPRVVFASTNHVVGQYEVDNAPRLYELDDDMTIDEHTEVRPDSPYGASKVFGEALGRYYADTRAMSVICLRIGSVREDNDPYGPTAAGSAGWLNLDLRGKLLRSRATWLSRRDCVQLFRRSLTADVAWSVAFGTSANPRLIWSLGTAERDLGYQPQDGSPETLPTDGPTP